MTMVVSSAGSQCNEIVTDGSCMLEDDWNLEAANMIEEVLRTQQEVSALLAKNTNVTSELQALKESCSKDVSSHAAVACIFGHNRHPKVTYSVCAQCSRRVHLQQVVDVSFLFPVQNIPNSLATTYTGVMLMSCTAVAAATR